MWPRALCGGPGATPPHTPAPPGRPAGWGAPSAGCPGRAWAVRCERQGVIVRWGAAPSATPHAWHDWRSWRGPWTSQQACGRLASAGGARCWATHAIQLPAQLPSGVDPPAAPCGHLLPPTAPAPFYLRQHGIGWRLKHVHYQVVKASPKALKVTNHIQHERELHCANLKLYCSMQTHIVKAKHTTSIAGYYNNNARLVPQCGENVQWDHLSQGGKKYSMQL